MPLNVTMPPLVNPRTLPAVVSAMAPRSEAATTREVDAVDGWGLACASTWVLALATAAPATAAAPARTSRRLRPARAPPLAASLSLDMSTPIESQGPRAGRRATESKNERAARGTVPRPGAGRHGPVNHRTLA